MPGDLGLDAHLGVGDDEIVGSTLVGPSAIRLVVELQLTCREDRYAVPDVAAEHLSVEICAHSQGEVDGVRFEFELGECLVAERWEFLVPSAVISYTVLAGRAQSRSVRNGRIRPSSSRRCNAP